MIGALVVNGLLMDCRTEDSKQNYRTLLRLYSMRKTKPFELTVILDDEKINIKILQYPV